MARGRGASKGVRARGRGGKGRSSRPSTMPPQLRQSYLTGKASAKIAWRTPGDFNRCVAEATHHGIPARMRKGMCNKLHVLAVGAPPGKGHGGKRG